MRIITVSREFGSGGRELGKRMAEHLGFDYYDREIITTIAQRCKVSEDYAEYLLNNRFPSTSPIVISQSFQLPEVMHSAQLDLLKEQTRVIKEIAKSGRNCVIVGRNADLLLEEEAPFNIFVCADTASKIKRCQERAQNGEDVSEKKILSNIKLIDKNRRRTREMISDSPWGSREAYNLIVNTTGWDIKKLAPYVAGFAVEWFEENGK